ncbi:hypothetical protein AGMMS49974_06830 [Deltaproteobacteria bacterium]|nr:hypothetical protein AGMMS49974_06830 [Deltaproteobacteria bacterium]
MSLITAFHVIEHLKENDINEIISESYRILKPHGILILETQNQENIETATNNFWIDQTHNKPIPPVLLSYFVHTNVFERVKILRLNEEKQNAL